MVFTLNKLDLTLGHERKNNTNKFWIKENVRVSPNTDMGHICNVNYFKILQTNTKDNTLN